MKADATFGSAPRREQQADDVGAVERGGEHQRRLAVRRSFAFGVGAAIEQQLSWRRRRPSRAASISAVVPVDVRALTSAPPSRSVFISVALPAAARQMQRRVPAESSGRADVGAREDQHRRQLARHRAAPPNAGPSSRRAGPHSHRRLASAGRELRPRRAAPPRRQPAHAPPLRSTCRENTRTAMRPTARRFKSQCRRMLLSYALADASRSSAAVLSPKRSTSSTPSA